MMKKPKPSCRRVRGVLQDWADGAPIPDAVRAHLLHCARCRSFKEFLSAYPRALRAGLDGRMSGWAAPSLPAESPAGPPAPEPVIGADLCPGRRPWWAVGAAAAAVLLVAGWGAGRLYGSLQAARVVRAAVSAEVERLYAVPLAGGVESVLAKPEPGSDRMLEGFSPDSGLEGLGAGGFLD
jgi:hypothetical protein